MGIGDTLKTAIVGSRLARRVAGAVIRNDVEFAREQFGPLLERNRHFRDVDIPDGVHGFEDLDFLFASNRLNQGIVLLTIKEAALLWRAARRVTDGTIVEIGRFKGGSTIVAATAMGAGAQLYSYDLHAKLTGLYDYPQLDQETRDTLERLGVNDRVHLIVGDSTTAEPPPGLVDLVFIDGDHSYEGARADFDRWKEALAPGGTILFHDANAGPLIGGDPNVARVVADAEREGWKRISVADTIIEVRRL